MEKNLRAASAPAATPFVSQGLPAAVRMLLVSKHDALVRAWVRDPPKSVSITSQSRFSFGKEKNLLPSSVFAPHGA